MCLGCGAVHTPKSILTTALEFSVDLSILGVNRALIMGDHYYARTRHHLRLSRVREAPASPLNGAYPEVLGTKWDSRLALGGKQRHEIAVP